MTDGFIAEQVFARHASFKASHGKSPSGHLSGHLKTPSGREFDRDLPQMKLLNEYARMSVHRRQRSQSDTKTPDTDLSPLPPTSGRLASGSDPDLEVSRTGTTHRLYEGDSESAGSATPIGTLQTKDQITPIPDFPAAGVVVDELKQMEIDDREPSPTSSLEDLETPEPVREMDMTKARGSHRDVLRSMLTDGRTPKKKALERASTFSGVALLSGGHKRGSSNPFLAKKVTAPPQRKGLGNAIGHRQSRTETFAGMEMEEFSREEMTAQFFASTKASAAEPKRAKTERSPLRRSATAREVVHAYGSRKRDRMEEYSSSEVESESTSYREAELQRKLERARRETSALKEEARAKDLELERVRRRTKQTSSELRKHKFEVDLLSSRLSLEEQQKQAALDKTRLIHLADRSPHHGHKPRPTALESGTGAAVRRTYDLKIAFDRVKAKAKHKSADSGGRYGAGMYKAKPSTKLIYKKGARRKLWTSKKRSSDTMVLTSAAASASQSRARMKQFSKTPTPESTSAGARGSSHSKTKEALKRLALHLKRNSGAPQTHVASTISDEEKTWEAKKRDTLAKENEELKAKLQQLRQQLTDLKAAVVTASVSPVAADKIVPRKHKRRPSVLGIIRPKVMEAVPSARLKGWDWVPIADEYIAGTKWRTIGAHASTKSFYSIEAEDFKVQIPEEFEEMFASSEPDLDMDELSDLSSEHHADDMKEISSSMTMISSKRSSAMKSVLRALKCTPPQLRTAVMNAEASKFGRKLVKALQSIVPTEEECAYVRHKVEVERVSKSKLRPEEMFVFCLADLDKIPIRLQLWQQKIAFEDSVSKATTEVTLLREALKSIENSVNLPRILRIVLEVGNFLNCDRRAPLGVYGFQLDSLATLSRVKARHGFGDGVKAYSLLTFVYRMCVDTYPTVLDVMKELRVCEECCKLESALNGSKINLLVTTLSNDLNNIQKALRTFRSSASKKAPKLQAAADTFESVMRAFYRSAEHNCKYLTDTWTECVSIGRKVGADYDFEYRTSNSFEEMVLILGNFIAGLRAEKRKLTDAASRSSSAKPPAAVVSVESVLQQLPQLDARVLGSGASESSSEEVSMERVQIAEAPAELRDVDAMSKEHVDYLKGLAKSSELASQSADADSVMREKRRRRSLSQTDIQIGIQFNLDEDEEVE